MTEDTKRLYDPSNITKYLGKRFFGSKGNIFEISEDKKFYSKNPPIEGEEVVYLAGFSNEFLDSHAMPHSCCAVGLTRKGKTIEELMRTAQAPDTGLHLVVILGKGEDDIIHSKRVIITETIESID